MIGHRGHYMKGSARGYLPGRFVSVVVRTEPAGHTARTAGVVRTRFLAVSVACCHRRGAGYSRPVTLAFGSAPAFWEWLESDRLTGRKTYVVSPVASDSLTLLGMWDRWDECGAEWAGGHSSAGRPVSGPADHSAYIVHRRVLAGMPDIIEYSRFGRRYRWCSGSNYIRDTEDQIARATGYKWRSMSDADDTTTFQATDTGDRALMWLHAITHLACWWREQNAGRLPATLAQMGYQYLQSRTPPKTVSSHTNHDVIVLERRCCHGGRATAWYRGDIREHGRHTDPSTLPFQSAGSAVLAGPIHHVDIRSMYPAIMQRESFPVKYSHCETGIDSDRLRGLLSAYHAVARVAIDTEIAEYPYRSGDRVLYPVGRFTSYLSTPDLIAALEDGVITKVHEVALYYRGRPWERAARELLGMRAAAELEGNKAKARYIKGITNAMTGKLAQRKGIWQAVKGMYHEPNWDAWLDDNPRTGEVTRFRCVNGLVERYDKGESGTGTHTAAYAVLTAYGRVLMRRIRESLPARSVLSMDTDGLWVTSAGLAELTRTTELVSGLPGLLRLVQSVANARFWDSRHYYAGMSWILAGISDPGPAFSGSTYRDVQALNPIRMACLGPPSELMTQEITGTLECNRLDGNYGEDGWHTPYHLPLRRVLPPPIKPHQPELPLGD